MNHKEIVEQEKALVRRVFGTEDGQLLLKILADNHVWCPIAHENPYVTYRRLGQQELIINFINIIGEDHE